MKATPRIHGNDEVTLDLSFDISSLTAQSFNQIPVISNESVEQTVRLKQNETAVVAGFRQTQLSNAITGNAGSRRYSGSRPVRSESGHHEAGFRAADPGHAAVGSARAAPGPRRVRRAGIARRTWRRCGEPSPAFNPPPGLQAACAGTTPPPPPAPSASARAIGERVEVRKPLISTTAWLRGRPPAGTCAARPARRSRSTGPAD